MRYVGYMDSEETGVRVNELAKLILGQIATRKTQERNDKINKLLLLLGSGLALATAIAIPNSGRVLRKFLPKNSDWEEWKEFNGNYLKRTIKRLDKTKIVRINEKDGIGYVELTEKGNRKIMRMGLETLTISKPTKWDGQWRMVFYDVVGKKNRTRDVFRRYLRSAGFYLLQASVYLHAYPCENEIEFLKNFLGIGSEVRVILASRIENDLEFRKFFGL